MFLVLCTSHDINIFPWFSKLEPSFLCFPGWEVVLLKSLRDTPRVRAEANCLLYKRLLLFPNLVNLGKKKKKVKGKGSGGQEEEQMTCLVSDSFLGTGQKWALAVFPGDGWTGAAPRRIPSCSQPILRRLARSFHPRLGEVMMWSRCVKWRPEAGLWELAVRRSSQGGSNSPSVGRPCHLLLCNRGPSWQMVLMWYYNCFCFGWSFLSSQLIFNILGKSFCCLG